MYPGPLAHSLLGDALTRRVWELSVIPMRDFGIGIHQKVDDSPYGGGAGMVLKPDVVDAAIEHAKLEHQKNKLPHTQCAQLIHFTPRGEPLTQQHFRDYSTRDVILIAGRYEAIDQRVLDKHTPHEISLGDFVLTGGDIPAMAFIEGCVRLLPGVVGKSDSLGEESFGDGAYANLLEYPHYTKPAEWEGRNVPPVLTSGNHAEVAKWRLSEAENLTKLRRPDLWENRHKK